MPKKYLLYIHDDRFANEPQKSGLINLLLARHYDYFKPGTLVEELPAEDQELHKDAVVGNPDLREHLDKLKARSQEFCKEGHPIPEGRSKCLGKGCKYS